MFSAPELFKSTPPECWIEAHSYNTINMKVIVQGVPEKNYLSEISNALL